MDRLPSKQDLALIDPEGHFRTRLLEDGITIERYRDAGQFSELESIVHRLAGAAGTFGYAEVGDIAIALDDGFVAARQSGAAPPDVTPLLDALSRALL